jgi:hypothetical protein
LFNKSISKQIIIKHNYCSVTSAVILGLNQGCNIDSPGWSVSCSSSVPLRNCSDTAIQYVTTACFHILLIYHILSPYTSTLQRLCYWQSHYINNEMNEWIN